MTGRERGDRAGIDNDAPSLVVAFDIGDREGVGGVGACRDGWGRDG